MSRGSEEGGPCSEDRDLASEEWAHSKAVTNARKTTCQLLATSSKSSIWQQILQSREICASPRPYKNMRLQQHSTLICALRLLSAVRHTPPQLSDSARLSVQPSISMKGNHGCTKVGWLVMQQHHYSVRQARLRQCPGGFKGRDGGREGQTDGHMIHSTTCAGAGSRREQS